jgi:hypothetical protein
MKWTIENYNGTLIHQGHDKFSVVDKSNASRIFLCDGKRKCGFCVNNGVFFVNSMHFNMKIDLENYELQPIYKKTGSILISQYGHENKLHSCNIGYKLIGQDDSYEYLMSILHNGEIHLVAKHFEQNKVIDQKDIRLQ